MRRASLSATAILVMVGQLSQAAPVTKMHGVELAAHDAARGRDIVGDDPIAAFARALFLRMGEDILGLGGKAHDERRPVVLPCAEGSENVGIFDEGDGGLRRRGFLELLVGRMIGAPVGDRGGADRDVDGQRVFAGREHFARGLDMHAS